MHVLPPEIGGPAALSRRAFLGCCSALLVASAGCSALSPRMKSAYALITDPPLAEYQPVLDALVESILPGPGVDFPVSTRQVRTRLLSLFPLESDPRFLGMQKALVLFDQTDLFAQPLTPNQQEEVSRDAAAQSPEAASTLARGHAHDVALYSAFAGGHSTPRFSSLVLDRRREYLDLWRASGYLVRRQFYASARSLVMISAYSMDAVWPVMHYGGPFVTRRRS